MLVLWSSLVGLILYLELVYHFSGFGWSGFQFFYVLALAVAWAGAETLLIGVLRGRVKKICFQFTLWVPVVWTGAQLVYLRIFRQPMLWEAIFRGGGDALTNYWREALDGIVGSLPFLALLILPVPVYLLVMHKLKWKLPDFAMLQVMRTAVVITAGIAGAVVVLEVGRSLQAEYYEDYTEFYDPMSVAGTMGVLPTFQRDTLGHLQDMVGGLFAGGRSESHSGSGTGTSAASKREGGTAGENAVLTGEGTVSGGDGLSGEGSLPGETGTQPGEGSDTGQEAQPHPQQFELDYELLHSLADNKEQAWLADYIQGLAPVESNAYTGIFSGYNLIYLTAEGFSSYAIREDLTPTLYRLANTGFVFDNYYVPLWQTSTSDGEYINCTGLIPDGQFSMRKSGDNNMAYTLPRFFAQEGVESLAYHDNTLSYYDRHVTHPNLGYLFKGSSLGKLSGEEWEAKIFPMEHPDAWPASDLEMMQGTIPEYIGRERFHVYYMTVSGHMNYNFKGNAMSGKNREAVSGLDMSENARAYIACNMELDKALEYLLEELEKAGQLEKTVICLSADHYPYGMTQDQYEELAGKSLSEGKDLYRNTLILWNAGMEAEPVHVEKVCGSMDIIPTLLNLFGFDYDSRMYAGRDIFSQEEGLVIFNDRSFVTDACINPKGKPAIWLKDEDGVDLVPDEEKEDYLAAWKQEVKNRYQFSAYILREDYYSDVQQAVIQEP